MRRNDKKVRKQGFTPPGESGGQQTFAGYRSIHPELFFQKGVLKNIYSQAKICARLSFLTKLQACGHRCFPLDFAKFLRTPLFIEHFWWLLLWVCTIL